jgi:hypothetical protein
MARGGEAAQFCRKNEHRARRIASKPRINVIYHEVVARAEDLRLGACNRTAFIPAAFWWFGRCHRNAWNEKGVSTS